MRFILSSVLPAFFLISSFAPAANAAPRPDGLRRRCTATPGSGGNTTIPTAPPTAPPSTPAPAPQSCYPSLEFDPSLTKTPVGTYTPDSWWCAPDYEYGFLGFSYSIEQCPSKGEMTDNLRKMRENHGARYVRIYASCDGDTFWSDLIDAAFEANVGIYALVWFGFDGDDKWVGRLERLASAIENNPLAPFVVRSLAIGSEALFDSALAPDKLVSAINDTKDRLSKVQHGEAIEVSTSDMPYILEQHPEVAAAADNLQLNLLPFFGGDAREGGDDRARNAVTSGLSQMRDLTDGKKKIIMTQTGWPSTDEVWKANSPEAVASVENEKAYFDLLDSMCKEFKTGPAGGYGWFAHMWDDNSLPGWGVTRGGEPKFDFKPSTTC